MALIFSICMWRFSTDKEWNRPLSWRQRLFRGRTVSRLFRQPEPTVDCGGQPSTNTFDVWCFSCWQSMPPYSHSTVGIMLCWTNSCLPIWLGRTQSSCPIRRYEFSMLRWNSSYRFARWTEYPPSCKEWKNVPPEFRPLRPMRKPHCVWTQALPQT